MTTPPTTHEEFIASRYILDAPEIEVMRGSAQRYNSSGRAIHFPTRIQEFRLTYYADFIDDVPDGEDEADLLDDASANELAREALAAFVEKNRLIAIGRVICDSDIDGMEPNEATARHDLEFTITYVIEEDITGVEHLADIDPFEEGEPYEDATDRRNRLASPPARSDPNNNAGKRSTLGMTDNRVVLGEFLAEVRAAGVTLR